MLDLPIFDRLLPSSLSCHPPAGLLLPPKLLRCMARLWTCSSLLPPPLSVSGGSFRPPTIRTWIYTRHAQLSDFSGQPLILAVFLVARCMHRRQHIVARLVVLAHLIFLFLWLDPIRIRPEIAFQQRGQPPVGLGGSYSLAT